MRLGDGPHARSCICVPRFLPSEMKMFRRALLWTLVFVFSGAIAADGGEADRRYPETLNLDVPHISSDSAVTYDYPIVYVRVPRKGDDVGSKWAEIAHPVAMDPGGTSEPASLVERAASFVVLLGRGPGRESINGGVDLPLRERAR